MEVDSSGHAENILKIKTFKMSLATDKDITTALGKQEVTNCKRITMRKGEVEIQTNTYIPTFKLPRIPKEIKITYFLERVEQYKLGPLRYFKCQKYDHHMEGCKLRQTCARCWEKDPDETEEDC